MDPLHIIYAVVIYARRTARKFYFLILMMNVLTISAIEPIYTEGIEEICKVEQFCQWCIVLIEILSLGNKQIIQNIFAKQYDPEL